MNIKTMAKENCFDCLSLGDIFLNEHSYVYMKTENISFYDEDSEEVCEANAVNLSNGRMAWFHPHTKVIIPRSHNLFIER